MTPEQAKTIERTAEYVLKNGASFEKRLRLNNKEGKFDFLSEDNEHNSYYKEQLKLQNKSPNEVIQEEIAELPRPLHFQTHLPMISPKDLDIIKLTALYVAKNGEDYLTKLIKHENSIGNKAQFEFTSKNHSLNELFKEYISQYKKVIDDEAVPPKDLLRTAMARAIYDKQNKVKLLQEKQEKQDLKKHYALIEWQDFFLVGVFSFDAVDEVQELAIPLKREELLARSLEGRRQDVKLEVGPKVYKTEEIKEHTPKVVAPKGMKIRAAGESRLKRSAQEPTILCPITGKQIPELKFDVHLKILVRDPRYKQEQENFMKKNFTYGSNLTTDQVYENIKRLVGKRGNDGEESDRKR